MPSTVRDLTLGLCAILFLMFLQNVDVVSANEPETIDQIRATFKQPGRDYSSGPLWTWNDLLTEEQIRSTLQDMAAQHVKQVWVHPRPGLMTPYLGEDWFRMWEISLDEAEKLDMNVWIYDENSYPSGFAGGFVPEALPDSRGKGLHIIRVPNLDTIPDDIWYVYKITKNADGVEQFENVTAWAKEQGKLPGGEWLLGKIQLAGSGGWFGGWWYVDLLKKGVTEKFIEITMEPYRKHFGEQFGKRLPGWFTDEPHLQTAGGLTWNEEIPVLFEQKFGYSLIDSVPSLTQEIGDWKRVRHNYQQLLLELFIDRWAKPCFEYCEKNNLEFTGHYWEHGWPGAGHGPDNMAMYAWHQRPAIDILMNQYAEHPNSQFGNARAVKELSSAANQMGYKRTLSETYGAGGWDLRFEDMKRIADWQYALGVNTTNEHLSYVTIRGARKRDHPQSFSYHSSWWDAYHVMADYHTRLSYALTRGEQVNHVLVIEPTTTCWMYQGSPHLSKIGNDFQNLVNQLEAWQCEYDLGSEDIIARFGKVENGKFVVNKRAYDLVILPPNMENINGKTLDLLVEYVKGEGGLICCSYPERVDGDIKRMDIKQMLGDGPTVEPQTAVWQALLPTFQSGFHYSAAGIPATYWGSKPIFETTSEEVRKARPAGKVFHHRRIVDGGEILFLCNTDIGSHAVGTVTSHMKGVEQWCIATGNVSPYPMESESRNRISFHVDLPPCGSLLLFLSDKPVESQTQSNVVNKVYQPLGEAQVKRLEPNVLTLDYVDVAIGDENRANLYTFEANSWIWQKHGFAKNPWDNEVQFKDQLLQKTFPNDSGFSATYRFTLADNVPNPLFIVIERPDLYAISCNGKPVAAKDGDWWLDRSFGKVDLATAAKIGENEVTLTARPMTMWHELEAAYLIGDFSLAPAAQGFLVKPSQPLKFEIPENQAVLAHSQAIEHVAWLSSGVDFAPEANLKDDHGPYVVFDLGAEKQLKEIQVWNYNEANLIKRGVKELKISANAKDGPLLGTFTLSPGSSRGPQTLVLDKDVSSRYVVFEILSNQNGITFPVAENAKNLDDNAFVGLSEVKFFTQDSEIPGVKIHHVSSELVARSHNRKAEYLVDGSGLEPMKPGGWNDQGMPFYADGVAYTQTFDLGNLDAAARYAVALGKWYGSVAKMIVNGKEAGYIGFAPWECDISKHVQSGRNAITVVVIGTPKNLLGPHHNGSPRGTAWPGMFWNAPKDGPPPGILYDVIGYGLFEPFCVKQIQ